MKKLFIADIVDKIDQEVELYGWVNNIRDHKKIIFVDLRDRSGILQVVGDSSFNKLSPEDVIYVKGIVKKRPENMVNKNILTGEIEVQVKEGKIIAESEELPIDISKDDLNLNLPTLLDFRSLTLRHPKIKAIFKVQEVVIDAFRRALQTKDFFEFQEPSIISSAPEGGADIFELN